VIERLFLLPLHEIGAVAELLLVGGGATAAVCVQVRRLVTTASCMH